MPASLSPSCKSLVKESLQLSFYPGHSSVADEPKLFEVWSCELDIVDCEMGDDAEDVGAVWI